jgi:hypothetical protein
MPYVLQIRGRTAVVEDAEVRRLLDRLIRQTRIRLWARAGGPDSMFEHYYHVWEQHNRCHSINLFVLTMELLGGADLPSANQANRLKREQAKLTGLLRPNSIHTFYQRFSAFNRKQAIFVRQMKAYQSRMITGAGRTVRVLELTRNTSFATLSVCATILTAGAASSGAAAAASSGTGALLREAATQFVVSQIQTSANDVGRLVAGERVTGRETVEGILDNALNALPNAMLGGLVGKFMGPLTGQLSTAATRALRSGSILRCVGAELSRNQIEAAVTRAIDRMMNRQPGDIRRYLHSSRRERNNAGHATVMANGLSQNRTYLRFLEIELNNEG